MAIPIIVSAAKNGDCLVFHQNTTGAGNTFQSEIIFEEATVQMAAIQIADLDRDGDGDIIFQTPLDNPRVGYLENSAGDASSWQKRGILKQLSQPVKATPSPSSILIRMA